LLRSDDSLENGIRKTSPLARYAAENWVSHAQFENVSSYLRKPMEYLFDTDKPYFSAWVGLYDGDLLPESSSPFYDFCCPYNESGLVYAALCGFYDLVEYLIVKYPQQVNARDGCYDSPLVAALSHDHFKVAELLIPRGATVDFRGHEGCTPLQFAADYEQIGAVRLLLKHKADVNYKNDDGETALHFAAGYSPEDSKDPQNSADIARLLIGHGAKVHSRSNDGTTPLHAAAKVGNITVAGVLLEHGANVDEKDDNGKTPLRLASEKKQNEMMKFLSEHGAKRSW